MAEESLRRFSSEIAVNRKSVAAVKEYHVTTQKSLSTYLAAEPQGRSKVNVNIHGLQPAFFEHTAWDLALVTQSLAYIEPSLAFSLSRIYTVQQEYDGLSHGILQAMYLRTPSENKDAFFSAVAIYYGDVVGIEPQLLAMYDEIGPRIDRALGR